MPVLMIIKIFGNPPLANPIRKKLLMENKNPCTVIFVIKKIFVGSY